MAFGVGALLGHEEVGGAPDLTTLGKYIGGGLGFGVVGGAEKLMLRIARGGERSYDHSGTFNNNRFSMAASSAMLGTVLTRSSLDALFERGEDLRKRADHVLREHGFQATGWGSLMGFHPRTSPSAARPTWPAWTSGRWSSCSTRCWSGASTPARAASPRCRCRRLRRPTTTS
ncbi:aminotransferase class III-fold pyridoxal phosphate-dependent enzyme [Streptomyces yangpuensis]|uniref:aminotransferase class III-fold pyridoxal phosphate-dependent enzyme n=1 Tax=Streptomyces yangpuensis TaxID=1648182 RepID=UPI003654D7AD